MSDLSSRLNAAAAEDEWWAARKTHPGEIAALLARAALLREAATALAVDLQVLREGINKSDRFSRARANDALDGFAAVLAGGGTSQPEPLPPNAAASNMAGSHNKPPDKPRAT